MVRLEKVLYGGDYNPDQWDKEYWDEDIRQFKVHNINTVTLPVFSWGNLEKTEGEFDFSWLDEILDKLYENDIKFIMATPTAAHPAWMSKKYPDTVKTDKGGRKRKHGGRVNFCPNSENYRRLSKNIAGKLAERYKDHPGLMLWHINNEMGSYCYCENCAKAFRQWLKEKYGTIENLNKSWYSSFWGHTYTEWDEIDTVTNLNEILPGALVNRDGTNFQAMAIDYHRFMSKSILDCYRNEREEIRKFTPNTPCTTNIWGIAPELDLFEWGEEMDIAAWDNYPSNLDMPHTIGFRHDIIRGIKGGNPFILMEQTPNQQNWQAYNATKRPGVMRLLSYQAMAHGSDAVLFFQLRQSRGACEKYHAAVIPHANTEETRIGRELTQLGEELTKLDCILGSKNEAKVGLLMDWQCWWGVEYSSGPSVDIKYVEQLDKYYKVLHDMNIPVDIINPTKDFSKYDVILAPAFYMVSEETTRKIEGFVENGGTFVTNFMSGLVDENDQVIMGGYPGAFRNLLGIWVEETDALYPHMRNEVNITEGELSGNYSCGLICDVVNLEGAKAVGNYTKDYYAGAPAITENNFGKGKAVYLATEVYDELLTKLVGKYCNEKGINSLVKPVEGVEVTKRINDGKEYLFILNHSDESKEILLPEGEFNNLLNGKQVMGKFDISPKDVVILGNDTMAK